MEALDIFSYFLLLLLLLSGVKVVTTSNVIHAAIFLVFTLATTAVLFILLSAEFVACLLYTSPSPRDKRQSRMPSSA